MRLGHNMFSMGIYKNYTRALAENSKTLGNISSGASVVTLTSPVFSAMLPSMMPLSRRSFKIAVTAAMANALLIAATRSAF